MAVKIHEKLQRWDSQDPEKRWAGKLDEFKLRDSATAQSSGTPPYAAGWGECADAMGVEVSTARHILRQLACSEYKPSQVNSCYGVRWMDVTRNKLLSPSIPFETLPDGCEPLMFEDPKTGNKKYRDGKHERNVQTGKHYGRGYRKVADTIKYDR